MYYNYLNTPSLSRNMQSIFAGLNKNARIGDGEIADMKNMSGDAYPLMMPRAKRVIAQRQIVDIEEVTNEDGTTETVENPRRLNGILGDVGFAAVWGNDFYYMGKKVDGITLIDGEKKLIAMGAYVLIYPDTVYYNTETGEYGQMETGESESGSCNFDLDEKITFENGMKYGEKVSVIYKYIGNRSDIKEVKLIPNLLAIDENKNGTRFANYSDLKDKEYVPVRISNGKLEYLYAMTMEYSSGGASGVDVSVKISDEEWKVLPVKSVTVSTVPSLAATNNLWYGENYVKIEGKVITFSEAGVLASAFESSEVSGKDSINATYKWTHKNLPALDYICVHDNRLWGCRYGMQANGKTVNEIYCSALGDFRVWTISSTTATGAGDPYAMSVGEYGAFTGCVSLRGQLLFFKDDIVYRVSGNKPSNFQIDKISESGLQSGCEKSLEIIDEVLYYKSRNGVFAYDGSIPQKISDALGNFYYTDAVAGKHFSKYYITMVHDGVRCLYVYDKRTGLWHCEDDADIRFFTEYDGALYGAVGNDIVCLSGTPASIFNATDSEKDVKWYAETGDIGLDSPYPKYYHRLLVRMDIEIGARVKVSLLCGDNWMQVTDFTSAKKQTVTLPIITPRCEHMRIRIEGCGMAKIYSIYYETENVEGRA